MSVRRTVGIALASLVPVWVYALTVEGGPMIALASSACVLLIVGGLYQMFGPHETETDHV